MLLMKGMEALKKAAEEPLYDESKGYTKEYTTLRAVLKLLMAKARYGLSDAGFDVFLSIFGNMLPKENTVLAKMYYAKKLISPLTMGVEKIHACRNHCILYRVMITRTWIVVQSVEQVGTRQTKTIERILLPPCVKQGRSKRSPKRTPNRVQNPLTKIKKRLTIMRRKRFLL